MSSILYPQSATLSFIAATLTLLLACLVTIRDRRSFASRSFIASLALLALAQLFRGLSADAGAPEDSIYWEKVRIAVSALQPGTCLLFCLAFARTEYRKYLVGWKYVVAAVFALPVLSVVALSESIFEGLPVQGSSGQRIIPLGYGGKIFYSLFLVSAVLILANLERTLRASTGRIRWQIKFIVLGMSGICAVWVYISSQALIYSALDTSLAMLAPAVLIAADLLFAWGLARSQFLNVDVYLSRTTIQFSLTALLAGVYLVTLGLLAYMVRFFNPQRPLPIDALLVLLALAGLAMLLLSDRLRERIRRFVIWHFKRPMYDYRKAWMELTEKTNSLVQVRELCAAVARIVSQTFGILSVNVWLCDRVGDCLTLEGSTVFTPIQARDLERSGEKVSDLLRALKGRSSPLDLTERRNAWADEIMRARPEYFREFEMRHILPVQTGGQLVGLITLNCDRVGNAPLSMEDQDLLNAYASQLAARVLQMRLADDLRRAQEVEAFQSASTFFVHDLKNLASRLSLTMQNLPAYFDNPDFRKDALKLIGESVARIDATCSRLSSLKQRIELRLVEGDLNELVARILDELGASIKTPLKRKLGAIPLISLDSEQLQKVVTNLILNAHEACNGKGSIIVETETIDHQVVLSVTDNGCGITQEFIENLLFRPFRTTKKRGMGIGLYHSKMIVEAHHGRIEVVSREGEGSTFRVILPVTQGNL
ncbi:MAG: PEP-CTERM system histidine kinase PrsK [Acidobacteriia bacterium]|nr:PEP-CTERM system histidine kinase PrsK [Terriglobia bacterium]